MSRIWLNAFAIGGVALATSLAGQLGWADEGAGRAHLSADANPASPEVRQARQRNPAANASVGEPLQVLRSGKDHTRLIYRGAAIPVTDLETTIKQLFASEGKLQSSPGADATLTPCLPVAIATSVVSNSLIVSGPPDAVEEVQKLLEGLDQPRRQIMLDVEIGEAPIGEEDADRAAKSESGTPDNAPGNQLRWAERPPKMKTIGRVQLTTLDDQPAFAQMGARVPMVVGVSKSADGEVRNTSLTNVGLIVGVTPRVTPDGSVVMEIDVELSQLGPEAEGVPISISGDKVVRTPQIDTTTIQSTATVAGGQTVILGAVTPRGQTDKALVVVVTPHIIGLGEPQQAPRTP